MVKGKLKIAYAVSMGEGTLVEYGYASKLPNSISELEPDHPDYYETVMISSPHKKFKDTGQ